MVVANKKLKYTEDGDAFEAEIEVYAPKTSPIVDLNAESGQSMKKKTQKSLKRKLIHSKMIKNGNEPEMEQSAEIINSNLKKLEPWEIEDVVQPVVAASVGANPIDTELITAQTLVPVILDNQAVKAIEYLKCFALTKESWKFNKLRQVHEC